MFSDEIYLRLSETVYRENYTIIDDYSQIILTDFTNENGYYNVGYFSCAAYKSGNKIIISFRGTNELGDLLGADMDIVLGNIPSISYIYAQNFYSKIKSLFPECEIEFTGHSLGGAIAQLMGAKYGNKTVTFNAPGMYNQLEDIGCSTNINYTNITNYTVLNDYVGNYKTHVGNTYYMQPLPIENDVWVDTHNGIFNYDENLHGSFISKPPEFTTLDALALWYFDINNTVSPNISIPSINENQLEHAISIVEQYFGVSNLQVKPLKCSVNGKYFVVGSTKDDVFTGTNKNDTLWGNGGNDLLTGGKGNDTLDGGGGVDEYVFVTGDGQDIIQETDEELTSVKDILYSVKDGRVNINSHILTGGTYNETTGDYVTVV